MYSAEAKMAHGTDMINRPKIISAGPSDITFEKPQKVAMIKQTITGTDKNKRKIRK